MEAGLITLMKEQFAYEQGRKHAKEKREKRERERASIPWIFLTTPPYHSLSLKEIKPEL